MNKAQPQTLTPDYFDEVYRHNSDPWNFETSDYERAKYAATLAALPGQNYENAFEIGCSIGVLTAQLAAVCQKLLAVDVSEAALEKARQRCADLPQVRFEKMQIPEQFPHETFDLILVSEVGYYLAPDDWRAAAEKIVGQLRPRGHVVLVHWTPFVHDYPQTGGEVHQNFKKLTADQLRVVAAEEAEKYLLDVFQKL